jgi:branched-chain amino acid transport system substrate-binding protein
MKRKIALAALALPLVPRRLLAQGRAPRKIGLTTALTGPFAAIATEYTYAYQLAVQHVNEAGGINGRQVQLLIEDSKANPADGIAAMRKLAQVDNVDGIVTFLTGVVTAQMPLADQLHMPTVAGVETSGLVDKSQYVFACGVRIAKAEPLMVDYWRKHNVKKVYAFLANNAVGQLIQPVIQQRAKEANAEVQVALINLGDADFRGEVARCKEFSPNAIYINTSGSSSADPQLIRQVREAGMNTQFYLPANFYTTHTWREAVGPYTEGMIFGGATVDRVQGAKFIRDYRSKMGFEPGYTPGELYDGAMILMHAMDNATTPEAIRDGLVKLKGVKSVLGGELSMGSDHYTNIPNISLWQVRNGVEAKIG